MFIKSLNQILPKQNWHSVMGFVNSPDFPAGSKKTVTVDGEEICFERIDEQVSQDGHSSVAIQGSFRQSTFYLGLDGWHQAYLQFSEEPLIGFYVDGGQFRFPHVTLSERLPKFDSTDTLAMTRDEIKRLHQEALGESLIAQMGQRNYRSYCDLLLSLAKLHFLKYFRGINSLIGIEQSDDLEQSNGLEQIFKRLKGLGERFELEPQLKIVELGEEDPFGFVFYTKKFKVTLILPDEESGRSEKVPTIFISENWGHEYECKGDCKISVFTGDNEPVLALIEYNSVKCSPDMVQKKEIKFAASLLKNGELYDPEEKLTNEQKQILLEYVEVFFDSLLLFDSYDLDQDLKEDPPRTLTRIKEQYLVTK